MFTNQLSNWLPSKEACQGICLGREGIDFVIKKSRRGFAVFTKGNMITHSPVSPKSWRRGLDHVVISEAAEELDPDYQKWINICRRNKNVPNERRGR